MLTIHGPTYRYTGEILTSPELILVADHHYDDENQCDHLAQLLQNSSCTHTVVFDHVLAQDQFDFECHYFPTLLARECCEFNLEKIQPNWQHKSHAFNFMINKPRPHRLKLLQIIDQFKLNNYRHSLCWSQSPVPSVAVTDYRMGNEVVMEKGFRNNRYSNAHTYQCLLQKQLFEPSTISLITEPAYYERETIVTEKTIMAIWGGTVPIWVGGWRIPNYMRSQGFDIFDDIVDHSYQELEDPEQRCSQAIIKNLELLQRPIDVDIKRLQHNLDLLITNPWLTQVNNLIKIYPDLRRAWPA